MGERGVARQGRREYYRARYTHQGTTSRVHHHLLLHHQHKSGYVTPRAAGSSTQGRVTSLPGRTAVTLPRETSYPLRTAVTLPRETSFLERILPWEDLLLRESYPGKTSLFAIFLLKRCPDSVRFSTFSPGRESATVTFVTFRASRCRQEPSLEPG